MLDLATLRFRNFLSYGDYWTEVTFTGLGQCLIVGDILDHSDDEERQGEVDDESPNSNGAGKSTLPNAILWCLFGRTMHSARPGTKVVNWFTDGDCVAELTLKNGDRITRVVTREGKTELMFVRNGHEERLTADTLATTKLHQAKLSRAFNLDWDIFCGSVFFNQYGRGWLEMPDNLRKQAMERMLRIDRFSLYADVAKEKMVSLDSQRAAKRKRLHDVLRNVSELDAQIDDVQRSLDGFESDRERRRAAELAEAQAALAERNAVDLPDLDQLRSKWGIVEKVREKIKALESESVRKGRLLDTSRDELRRKGRDKQELEAKAEHWRRRSGKECPTCEQPVESGHACGKVEPLQKQIDGLTELMGKITANLEATRAEIVAMDADRAAVEQKLAKAVPALTVAQAELRHREWKSYDAEARRALERAKRVEAEQNPHGAALDRVKAKKAAVERECETLGEEVRSLDALYPHYAYINRSYADRRKIKSYVFQNHIPFINQRLQHYLNVFNVDICLQFTDSLSINSDKWGYDFFCGGERKRADLALMLSVFDLHESIYGKQCNVMVLDEVDGRLDAGGIDSLVHVIQNELAQQVEALMIISHRSTLHSMFPRHIEVKRSNRLSYIDWAG